MSHEKWDEDKIEELLKNAPKIHDHRSKDEVFERLKKDGHFDGKPPKMVTKKEKTKYIARFYFRCSDSITRNPNSELFERGGRSNQFQY